MTRASGFKRARSKSKRRVSKLDENVADAIGLTVAQVHRSGRENMDAMVSHKTRRLRRGYSKRMIRAALKGSVGYVSSAARKNAFYAKFVHDGTSKAKANPFHDESVLENEGKHARRMRAANSNAIND